VSQLAQAKWILTSVERGVNQVIEKVKFNQQQQSNGKEDIKRGRTTGRSRSKVSSSSSSSSSSSRSRSSKRSSRGSSVVKKKGATLQQAKSTPTKRKRSPPKKLDEIITSPPRKRAAATLKKVNNQQRSTSLASDNSNVARTSSSGLATEKYKRDQEREYDRLARYKHGQKVEAFGITDAQWRVLLKRETSLRRWCTVTVRDCKKEGSGDVVDVAASSEDVKCDVSEGAGDLFSTLLAAKRTPTKKVEVKKENVVEEVKKENVVEVKEVKAPPAKPKTNRPGPKSRRTNDAAKVDDIPPPAATVPPPVTKRRPGPKSRVPPKKDEEPPVVVFPPASATTAATVSSNKLVLPNEPGFRIKLLEQFKKFQVSLFTVSIVRRCRLLFVAI
jgi:hypothetical protein